MKPIWQSKTILFNLLLALLAFFPQVRAWADGNEEAILGGIVFINLVLRSVTKNKVVLFPLLLVLLTLPSCASGNLQLQGDLSPLGIPAQFSYSSKNPITSGK